MWCGCLMLPLLRCLLQDSTSFAAAFPATSNLLVACGGDEAPFAIKFPRANPSSQLAVPAANTPRSHFGGLKSTSDSTAAAERF
jgi:hypothetical protein